MTAMDSFHGIDRGSADILRKFAWEAEQKQILHPEQLGVILRHKWFKLFVPPTLGGMGLSLPEALRIEESISYADGSTGWVVTLCAGAGWFVGFVDPAIARSTFGPESSCIAGSGALSGKAEKMAEGFVVTGLWPFASGCLHATAFTVNAIMTENDQPIYKSTGIPQTVTLIVPRTQVSIRKTWNAMGMVATASHSFAITKAFVPLSQCFTIDPKASVLPDKIYQYPFTQFAETTLAVNVSGMTCRFMDLARDQPTPTLQQRDRAKIIKKIESTREQLETARSAFFQSVSRSWEIVSRGNLNEAILHDVSRTSQVLVQVSRDCVNTVYPFTGLQGTFMDHEVNRVWRNIQTATQHALLNKI